MVEQGEIVTLILGIGCVILIIIRNSQLRRIPFSSLLVISYFCLFFGLVMTVLESFFLQDLLNLLEHFGYTLSTFLLTYWCWNIAFKNKGES
jgi:uncharacterized protein YacL